MLRLLSWSSSLAADKTAAPEVNYLMSRSHNSRAIDSQKPPMLKRKRIDISALDASLAPAKRRMESKCPPFSPLKPTPPNETSTVVPAANTEQNLASTSLDRPRNMTKMEETQPEADKQAPIRPAPDTRLLRQTLDAQIGLEILLRHKELRLIDQEIAKCQISLEQLRRCNEIPYPTNRPSEATSHGQGPIVRSSRSAPQPESPAPWGVADGPYSRHYAKWLLPDPLFDEAETPTSARRGSEGLGGKTPVQGRPTRGTFAESTSSAGRPRAHRAGKFQALSSGYAQPKDKNGPMIQKRKSDGQLVRLICLDCRRDNFSSAQGFINHCRIAHSRNFTSHDAAADACGEPVDVDGAGAIMVPEGSSTLAVGLVHPLIYSVHARGSHPIKNKSSRHAGIGRKRINKISSQPQSTNISEEPLIKDLSPSPTTPHLSALLQRAGAKLDLRSLVIDSRTPLSMEDSLESESEGMEEREEDTTLAGASTLSRRPHITGLMLPARSPPSRTSASETFRSRKGLAHLCNPQPASSSSGKFGSSLLGESSGLASITTEVRGDESQAQLITDLNQAPSLVDDDGDDDYEAHSPFYAGSGSSEGESRDVAVDIEDGDENGTSGRNGPQDVDFASTPKNHAGPTSSSRASALRHRDSSREAKHVSFVSLSSAREMAASSTRKGGEGKRKRTTSN